MYGVLNIKKHDFKRFCKFSTQILLKTLKINVSKKADFEANFTPKNITIRIIKNRADFLVSAMFFYTSREVKNHNALWSESLEFPQSASSPELR